MRENGINKEELQARQIIEKYDRRIKRNNIGLIAVAVQTILIILLMILSGKIEALTDVVWIIWFFSSVAVYIIGGIVVAMIRVNYKLVIGAWKAVPLFPVDIFIAMFAIGIIVTATIHFPIIYVIAARSDLKKEYEKAKEYLGE